MQLFFAPCAFDNRIPVVECCGRQYPTRRTRRRPAPIDPSGQREAHFHRPVMEFLNFLLILWAAWLLWRRPERERLAFGLLVTSCVIMAILFLIGTHGSWIPGVNL
jgi:hypothetical protein